MQLQNEARRNNSLEALRKKFASFAGIHDWEVALILCEEEVAFAMSEGNNHRETFDALVEVVVESYDGMA